MMMTVVVHGTIQCYDALDQRCYTAHKLVDSSVERAVQCYKPLQR
jgi:hypothetical protein